MNTADSNSVRVPLPLIARAPILSGLEIRAARINASRSTLPTKKRFKNAAQPTSHLGKKQAARIR
jgi:hypothetical protein